MRGKRKTKRRKRKRKGRGRVRTRSVDDEQKQTANDNGDDVKNANPHGATPVNRICRSGDGHKGSQNES